MVSAVTAAFYAEASGLTTTCRYKTGKCTNQRSSKRNGQPHMLCLYHRDKANKIQRKFDRQKRQSVRMKKTTTSNASAPVRAMGGAAAAFANAMMLAPPSASPSTAIEIYSDSDSSRFSTDSESSRFSTDSDSSTVASLELAWQNLPSSAVLFGETLLVSPTTSAASCSHSVGSGRGHGALTAGALSHEEIDFLYAAMLE